MLDKTVTKLLKDAKPVPRAAGNTFQPIGSIAARLLLRVTAPAKEVA